MEIIIDNKSIRMLHSGDSFGEMALLYSAPRSASIKVVGGRCYFWGLHRAAFKNCMETLMNIEQVENRKFIDEVSFFSFMTAQ